MSFSKTFEMFRDKPRVVLNDMYIGDEGAEQLATFLAEHTRVQSLEIKSNNISSVGFIQILRALQKNTHIKQIIAQYNQMGKNDQQQWYEALGSLVSHSPKLQRLNISNNKISGEGFKRIIYQLTESKSLKLLEIRYNSISSEALSRFVEQLKASGNDSLLYVETAGNKISKQTLESLEILLKNNRKNNPISKDKLMMTGGYLDNNKLLEPSRSQNSFNRTNAIDDLSKQNVLQHLETILDQNRKDTLEMKGRFESQLSELQRRQKLDSKEIDQLDSKCNQLIIQNRNIKFQFDRTTSEHHQIQRDQQYHTRVHEDRLREANKQLQQLQNRYEDLQNRMHKQHQLKMKEIARDWENRLRNIEQKIRSAENQDSLLETQLRKHAEKRERLRMEYQEEENMVRNRVEEQQTQKYNFKLTALESKIQEVEESREKYLHRNREIVYELEKAESDNNKEISNFEEQLTELRSKEDMFVKKNKDFITRNQNLKSDIQIKEISIEKLEEEINRFNEEIQLKKTYNREQIDKIIVDHEYDRSRREQEKNSQIHKLTELETFLRNNQLQNSKLKQQYAILAQKLQISLGKTVQDVFSQNHLY